ncbi:Erythronolide synthase, modules 3 and 4 [Folsomia candida]|uniref:Erythronolide synthase, modules 3 and 4 n=1 Tax=Folsomia candida TaxID=158441 RepID=A0A226D6A1_FOLCA|nr:Erythronolide synthase, modules 3 and 4 [Folsomia candida]
MTNYNTKSTFSKYVDHAYHSRSFEHVSTAFKSDLEELAFSTPNQSLQYISSMYGRKLYDYEALDPSYWSECFKQPVKFIKSAIFATSAIGGRLFLEVSPHPILSSLIEENCPGADVVTIPSLRRNVPNWTTLLSAISTMYLNRVELDWKKIWINLVGDHVLQKNVPQLLPTYPFQNEGPFWFNPSISSNIGDMGVRCKDKIIHPLLGSIISFPQCGVMKHTSTFITSTDALLERAGSWLRDHKVGAHNIYPAAGYIEMGFAVTKILSKQVKRFVESSYPKSTLKRFYPWI